jgi:salicylate biosynthesis isochorismate synthase/menaquinone-specific isochorismate synthase
VIEAAEALASIESLLAEAGEGRRLVSVTVPIELADPSAAVFGSRRADDRWFCWEQPDRDGFALAALGSAHEVTSRGPDRFDDVVAACAAMTRGRLAEEPPGLSAGAGPVWTGGFAFAPDGAAEPQWASFPPALMVMPELVLHRVAGQTHLTMCAVNGRGTDPREVTARLAARVAALRDGGLPLADPHPTGGARIAGAAPPEEFERSVATAVERIAARELEKVVLAREVVVDAPQAHDAGALYGALRELFPSCFCFCCGSPQGAFLGASPELLIRRSGSSAATVGLAGSTRRSADPSVDDHLGEQLRRSEKDRREHQIVVRRIERALRPHSVWVEAAPEPELVKVANIQHLGTPIHAQLSEPRSAIELAGLLHPTPAVGGEPTIQALEVIHDLEGLDRGWYAAPVGWVDSTEDGEFCVAIRSALLRDRTAHLFAGNGIVAESEPAAELAETEFKLDALLPLIAG